MTLLHTALLLLLVSVDDITCDSPVSYAGYKAYDIQVQTDDEVNHLKSFGEREGFDIWKLTTLLNSNATILVDPKHQGAFEMSLLARKMVFSTTISDLEKLFETERQFQLRNVSKGAVTFDRYLSNQEIDAYLDSLAENPLVKVSVIGKSFEGREIKSIAITKVNGRNKISVFIEAGIHGREWLAPSTALYLITQLLDGNNEASTLLDDINFVILPLVNPDSYQYSQTTDRLWRKTRSLNSNNCKGTDGNRNFGFHWAELGTSADPCSDIYIGSAAFSERETQALREAVLKIADTCKFYLSLHTYGDLLLYPWAWTKILPSSWEEIDEIARIGANAIRNATGKNYVVGSTSNVLTEAAGRGDDYMLAIVKIPISMTMDLPGGGASGYDPPSKDILRLVKESSVGVFAMAKAVSRKYIHFSRDN